MTKKCRVYKPLIVGGRLMMPADLERLHKYMLEIEGVEVISDEMRAGGLIHAQTNPPTAPDRQRRFRVLALAARERLFFLLPRRLVATTLLARDRAAIVSFDRGSHHAAVSPWADRDAAWADANGDV